MTEPKKCGCNCPHLAHISPDHKMTMRDLCELEVRCEHMGALGAVFADALNLIGRYCGAEGLSEFRLMVEEKERQVTGGSVN